MEKSTTFLTQSIGTSKFQMIKNSKSVKFNEKITRKQKNVKTKEQQEDQRWKKEKKC